MDSLPSPIAVSSTIESYRKGDTMGTKVYGASDDLVEFDGDFSGEVGCYGTDDREKGVLAIVSDGTILEVKYGKGGRAIWEVKLLKKGDLFDKIDPCTDEDADPYSDIAYFRAGVKWAYAATEWDRVS
jgi:hypothetical protein